MVDSRPIRRMRRTATLRVIYSELRSIPGIEAPAGDLLRLAQLILDSHDPVSDEGLDVYGRPRESRTFFSLPIDEAMKDGGWRILDFEAHRNFVIDDLDFCDSEALRIGIERILGPQWR